MRAGAVVVNFNGGTDLPLCLAALRAQTRAGGGGARRLRLDRRDARAGRATAGRRAGRAAGREPRLRGRMRGGPRAPRSFSRGDRVLQPGLLPGAGVLRAVHGGARSGTGCRRGRRQAAAAGWRDARLVRPGAHAVPAARARPRLRRARPAGAFETRARVLSACGAAMVYRRSALGAAAVEGEVFPVEFFAFWEDLDLGWRVNNAGWRVIYEPSGARHPPPRRHRRTGRGPADLPPHSGSGGLHRRQPLGDAAAQPAPG